MFQKVREGVRNRWPVAAFWLSLTAGVILRLWGIRVRPIWYDEAFSLLEARLELEMILQSILGRDPSGTIADQHPPGYFLGLFGWTQMFGVSIVSGRVFSVLLGILTLVVVFLIAREVMKANCAWVPVAFLAISPFHIHYSQEIRMYALMGLMLALAAYAMLKGSKSSHWGWWVLFGVASAVAQYSQHLAGVFLICLAMIPVLRKDWKNVKRTLFGGMGALLLYSPWLVNLPAQISSTGEYWVEKPGISRFLTLILAYFAGLPVPDGLVGVVLAGGIFAVLILLIFSIRIWRMGEVVDRQTGRWLAYLAFFPPVLLWLISQVWPVYVERALLGSAVFFSLWVGWVISHSLTKGVERWLLAGIIAVGSVVGVHTHLTYDGFPYADYEGVGDWLLDKVGDDELVVHSNKLSFLPMHYYHGGELSMAFVADPEGSGTDTLRIPTQEVFGIMESVSMDEAVGDVSGVWLVIFDRALEEAEAAGLDQHSDLGWFGENWNEVSRVNFEDLLVFHFRAD